MQDKECEAELERMAAEAGYALNLYGILGRGGHATTYRSDADLSWGLLAPPLLLTGVEHV